VRFARVPRVPRPGEIIHASASWQEPGGSGAVAAVQLRKLAGAARFYTVVGSGKAARRACAALEELGVELFAAKRPEPQRRCFAHTDDAGERTITVLGDRLGPSRDDHLPWKDLAKFDGVYFTAGDAGALRAARAARVLVATPRAATTLLEAGVELDVLVGSAVDRDERLDPTSLRPAPRVVVLTEGARGGRWYARGGDGGRYLAAPLPGPREDTYGAGDSFAAGLTFALAAGLALDEALGLAARCGAACLTGRGPYAGQLTLRP
jgi:ribokinase